MAADSCAHQSACGTERATCSTAIAMAKATELGLRMEEIESSLRRLPPKAAGIFSCCVSERLSEIYSVFVAKEKWGNPRLVRETLDLAWAFLKGTEIRDRLNATLSNIESGTPHAEKFSSVEGVCAQNLCIAVDITVRLCLEEPGTQPLASEYGFEALKAAICNKEIGFIDLGSGPDAQQFELRLINHPMIARELELQLSDLNALVTARAGQPFPIGVLESRAKKGHIDVGAFF